MRWSWSAIGAMIAKVGVLITLIWAGALLLNNNNNVAHDCSGIPSDSSFDQCRAQCLATTDGMCKNDIGQWGGALYILIIIVYLLISILLWGVFSWWRSYQRKFYPRLRTDFQKNASSIMLTTIVFVAVTTMAVSTWLAMYDREDWQTSTRCGNDNADEIIWLTYAAWWGLALDLFFSYVWLKKHDEDKYDQLEWEAAQNAQQGQQSGYNQQQNVGNFNQNSNVNNNSSINYRGNQSGGGAPGPYGSMSGLAPAREGVRS